MLRRGSKTAAPESPLAVLAVASVGCDHGFDAVRLGIRRPAASGDERFLEPGTSGEQLGTLGLGRGLGGPARLRVACTQDC
jgi:hypothetical protein